MRRVKSSLIMNNMLLKALGAGGKLQFQHIDAHQKKLQGQGIWPHALQILLDLQRQGVRAASCQQRHAVFGLRIAATESTCGLVGLTWHGREVARCGLRV